MYYLKTISFLCVLWLSALCACRAVVSKTPIEKHYATHFIEMLNQHQADSLSVMLHQDAEFIDTQNRHLTGNQRIAQGWKKYWEIFPDYHLEVENIWIESDSIAIFAMAKATYKNKKSESNENQWEIPMALQLHLINGKIKYWKMYGDTKIIYEIIRSNESE